MSTFAALLKIDWLPENPEAYRTLFLTILGEANASQPSTQQSAALQLLNVSC